MENKDQLKETCIKNGTCYCFEDIIGVMDKDSDFGFSYILLDK